MSPRRLLEAREAVLHATWEAFLADVPLTWIRA